jgi:alpha-beta hydrolase superfamily lysophospholipase
METLMDERTFVDAHGVKIFTRWWTVDDPRALVLIAHGASEHSGRYDRFARALNGAGIAAVALDQRGHGRTGSETGAGVMGPGGGEAVIDDLHELRTAARSALGGDAPVFLFGHSLGSLIGLAYLTRHADGLAGGVLCAIPADVDDVASFATLLKAADEGGLRDAPVGDLLDNNIAGSARTKFDWLSRDAAEVDRYIADPLCGDGNPLTYGFLIDLFDVVAPAREKLAAISCPSLVIAGDQDPAAAMGAHATTLAKTLAGAGVNVDITIYEGDRHELLNETNRDEITADIINWLSRPESARR